jgi:putative endonuclease
MGEGKAAGPAGSADPQPTGGTTERRPVRQRIGARGEDLAVAELESQGMQVLARNWRCKLGEIDVVALERSNGRDVLVFCEVKCRTGLGFGGPLESITHSKLRKLRQLTAEWLAREEAYDPSMAMVGRSCGEARTTGW